MGSVGSVGVRLLPHPPTPPTPPHPLDFSLVRNPGKDTGFYLWTELFVIHITLESSKNA